MRIARMNRFDSQFYPEQWEMTGQASVSVGLGITEIITSLSALSASETFWSDFYAVTQPKHR